MGSNPSTPASRSKPDNAIIRRRPKGVRSQAGLREPSGRQGRRHGIHARGGPGNSDPPAALAFSPRARYLANLARIGKARLTGPPVEGGCPKDEGSSAVARVNPGEFLRQVRAETGKIAWPSRRETVTTGIMVLIMTSLLGLFFFGIDNIFSLIVRTLLGLIG